MDFETPLISLIVAFFLVLNLATASLSPTVWTDEVMFADPAISFRLTGEFTSGAWPMQSRGQFWSGNAPLHSMLLSLWLYLVPIGPTGVRAINFVYISAAALAFWQALRISGLVQGAWARILFVALLLSGYGISYSYRSGRYDALGILLVALIVLALAKAPAVTQSRLVAVAGLSALLPWAGVQLAVMASVVLAAHVLVFRSINRYHVAVAGGLALGGLGLLAFLAGMGTLSAFRKSAMFYAESSHSFDALLRKLARVPRLYLDDKSSLLLLPLIPVLLLATRARQTPARRFAVFVAVIVLAVPVTLQLSGKFPLYYAWMIFIPLSVVAALTIDVCSDRKPILYGALALSVLASAIGIPARTAVAVADREGRDHGAVSTYVSAGLRPEDLAYVDYPAYYPAKPKAAAVFLPPYLNIMSPAERQSVTVAVLQGEGPTAAATRFLSETFGGTWVEAAAPLVPTRSNLAANWRPARAYLILAQVYELHVYRRAPASGGLPASASY